MPACIIANQKLKISTRAKLLKCLFREKNCIVDFNLTFSHCAKFGKRKFVRLWQKKLPLLILLLNNVNRIYLLHPIGIE